MVGYAAEIDSALTSFLRGWGPIEWRKQVASIPVQHNPFVAQALSALSDIEEDAFYMQTKIRRSGADAIAAVREFNAVWLAEESEHSRALAAMSLRYGERHRTRRKHGALHRDRRSIAALPTLLMSSVYSRGILAAYLTLGSLQEFVALTTYNALADSVEDQGAKEVLRQIARQEGRHMRFYRSSAVSVMTGSVLCQKFVRVALTRFWRPPGIDLLGERVWVDTFGVLLQEERNQERYLDLDRICSSMPGLGGLSPMRSFLADRKLVPCR
jgi:rubrerythrin